MAGLEKLIKAFEALKVFQPGNLTEEQQKKKDQPVTRKDKITNSNIIADCICSVSLRNVPDFPKFLGLAMETFLLLCDDPESDIRMVADECLNRSIKTLLDTNLGRLQVELYKEIKKNGSSRSLRAALWRFADMCHLIRPQKCRPYVVNLVPCISKMCLREEEAIQETLQTAMKKICPVLMGFSTDQEVKTLLRAFMVNIVSPSAPSRRTAANSMTWICQYSRKPLHFFSWLLNTLLDLSVPVKQDIPVASLLGLFLCLRTMLPQLTHHQMEQQTIKGSFGVTRKSSEVIIEPLTFIQIYELILHHLGHADHNVVTAALETLQQLLKNAPKPLLKALVTPGGIQRSSIFQDQLSINRNRSGSQIGRLPSVGDEAGLEDDIEQASEISISERSVSTDLQLAGQGDASTTDSSPISQHSPSIESLPLDETDTKDEEEYLRVTTNGEDYTNIEISSLEETGGTSGSTEGLAMVHNTPKRKTGLRKCVSEDHVLMSVDLEDNLVPVEIDISEVIQPTGNNNASPSILREGDIGSITDPDIPLIHCVRTLTSKFLLTGYEQGLIPDRVVRVSVKALALGCVASAITLHPKTFLLKLHKSSPVPGPLQDLRDLLLYTSHSDPQLKGNTALLVGNLINAALTESHRRFDLWAASHSTDSEPLTVELLIRQLISILEDDSSVAVRLALVALQACMNHLLNSVHSELALQIIMALIHLKDNPYWLVKVELLELLGSVDFKLVSYLEESCQELRRGNTHFLGLLHIQGKTLHGVIIHLFGDEDARVRHAAAGALVRCIPTLFYPVDHPQHDPVIAKSKEFAQSYLDPILHEYSQPPQPLVHGLIKPYHVVSCNSPSPTMEASLSRVVATLVELLNKSNNKHLTYGCCRALCQLSKVYLVTQYPIAWCYCPALSPPSTDVASPKKKSKTPSTSSLTLEEFNLGTGGGPLSVIMSIITSSSISLDLTAHQDALLLAGNLLAGAAFRALRPAEEASKINPNSEDGHWVGLQDRLLVPLANLLFTHVIRLMNICAHVIEEQSPGPPQTKPSLPSLPNAPSLSPIKRKGKGGGKDDGKGTSGPGGATEDKEKMAKGIQKDKEEEKQKSKKDKDGIGQFYNLPQYMKIYDVLKGAYSNYKISLDLSTSEKFGSLLRTSLLVLSQVLEVSGMAETGKCAEELLGYLKATFSMEPTATVQAVQQLLKALFGTNLASQWDAAHSNHMTRKPGKASRLTASMQPGLYYSCFTVPYTHFTQSVANATSKATTQFEQEEPTSLIGWLKKRAEKKIPTALKHGAKTDKQTEINKRKNSIASYIRLFEPLVIKALKYYTVTSSLQLQQQVLNLLTQLVQLRVNYCLLDSDQIFIGFVIKQFEYIEEGQIRNSETLIPHIFNFLVLLSYEKYHSKTIISMPKVIQLCDGIMASGQQPTTHAVPALQAVVHDLFVLRGASKAEKEIDTQREVVVSMLLRLVHYYQILDMFIVVLHQCRKEGEDRWKRLSRQIVDTVLPKLSAQQVNLENQVSLDVVHRLFESVAPSVFRPVDLLLKSLMGPPFDLSSVSCMQQWMCLILVVLRVLISQSKEETVLSRLQELGLHVHITMATLAQHKGSKSADEIEGHKVSEDELAVPEHVFARFLIQVIGIVASELQEQVVSLTASESKYHFLCQQLSHLFLYIMHMFQSGLFRRVAVAAMSIIRKETPPEYFSVDQINQAFHDIASRHPTLTLQWCNILILLNYENKAWWSEILQTQRKYIHSSPEQEAMNGNIPTDYEKCCNLEIVRRGGLVLFCDYVCENLTDAEHMTWVIINHVSDLISLCHEPPVQDFISAIHRNPAASGLFIQAIHSRCENVTEPKLVKKTLQCLEAIHLSQSGALLTLLIDKFLNTHHVAVARICDTIACRRVEMLLAESLDDSTSQLPLEDLEKLLIFIKSTGLARRHARLVSLLNKLRNLMSPDVESPLSPVNTHPLSMMGVKVHDVVPNKEWYLSIVKDQCFGGSTSPRECAQLLQQLDYSSILSIFMDKDFNMAILEECISLGIDRTLHSVRRAKGSVSSTDSYTPDTPPEKRLDSLLRASHMTLLRHINSIVNMLPIPHQMLNLNHVLSSSEEQYRDKLEDLFTDPPWFSTVFHLAAALLRHLVSLPILPTKSCIPADTAKDICRFLVLMLEMVYWDLKQDQLPSSSQLQTSIECCSVVLQHQDLVAVIGQKEQTTWTCSAIRTIYQLLTSLLVLPGEKLVKLPHQDSQDELPDTGFDDMHSAILACDHISELVHCLQTHLSPHNINPRVPTFLAAPIRNCIIGLARLQLVNSYARTPPMAWKLGWMPSPSGETRTTLPPLPLELLQEKDVLREFIARVNTLGWTSRTQFEETWMSLLGVLNPMNMDEDHAITPEEDIERAQCAVLAMQGITAILIQSMLSPQSGNPSNSIYENRPRDKPLAFLHTRCGKKLTSVRLNIEAELWTLTKYRHDNESHLPCQHQSLGKDMDLLLYGTNVETEGLHTHFKIGQMSVESIWGLVGMLDPSRLVTTDTSPESEVASASSSDSSPQQQYPPIHAISSPSEVKERSATISGLDIHSCLQFLLELYGQFLSPGANPRIPLMQLNETIKSVLALSDIFTERQQFMWMLDALMDVYKTHPTEDELVTQYLVVGICKAAAIVGVDGSTTEKIVKYVDSSMKSTHIPTRVAALYGSLYLLETGVSEMTHQLMPLLTDYLLRQLTSISHNNMGSQNHVMVMWTLTFYLLENYQEEVKDSDFINKIVQVAINTASAHEDTTSLPVYLCVLRGLERLVLTNTMITTDNESLIKLSVDRLNHPSPQKALASLNLLLTCMYAGKSFDQWNPNQVDDAGQSRMLHDPESLIIAMERVTVLFDRIRRGFPFEARVISRILPIFLSDFFPPQDIMNKVIGEFLSSQQPHPQLMAEVVFQVFDALLNNRQHSLVQDWVMLSLSNFTQRTPISMAVWSLTCFFVSASTNRWLRNLLPHIISRMGQMEAMDRRMFCIAALDFRKQIPDEPQRRAFHSIFQSVAQPDTPYADLLKSCS